MSGAVDVAALRRALGFSAEVHEGMDLVDSAGISRRADLVLVANGLTPRMVAGQTSTAVIRVVDRKVTRRDVREWSTYSRFIAASSLAIVGEGGFTSAAEKLAHGERIGLIRPDGVEAYWRGGEPSSASQVVDCWHDVELTLVYRPLGAFGISEPVKVSKGDGRWWSLGVFHGGLLTPQIYAEVAMDALDLPVPAAGRVVSRCGRREFRPVHLRSGDETCRAELHFVIRASRHNVGSRAESVYRGVRLKASAVVMDSDGGQLVETSLGAPNRTMSLVGRLRHEVEKSLPDDQDWEEAIRSRFAELLEEYKELEPVDPAKATERYRLISERVGIAAAVAGDTYQEQWYLRARPVFAEHEALREDPSQFGAPPASVVGLGRANLAGHPVFYASDAADVAIREVMSWDVGALVYVSTWRTRDFRPQYLKALGPAVVTETERINLNVERLAQWTATHESWVGPRVIGAIEAMRAGLARVFVEDENYALSSLIAHSNLYTDKADGIEYPDVATQTGFNYALGPGMFEKIELHRVVLLELLEGEYARALDVGVPDGSGRLLWRAVDPTIDQSFLQDGIGL